MRGGTARLSSTGDCCLTLVSYFSLASALAWKAAYVSSVHSWWWGGRVKSSGVARPYTWCFSGSGNSSGTFW